MIPTTRLAKDRDRQGSIYVVEPSAAECEALVETLESLNRPIVDLPSAEALLAAIDGERPICVVTDIDLPGRSGLELLRLLGERRPSVPAILIGRRGNVRGAVQALRDGAADYFQKPPPRRALREAVAACLRARTPASAIERPEELEAT